MKFGGPSKIFFFKTGGPGELGLLMNGAVVVTFDSLSLSLHRSDAIDASLGLRYTHALLQAGVCSPSKQFAHYQ